MFIGYDLITGLANGLAKRHWPSRDSEVGGDEILIFVINSCCYYVFPTVSLAIFDETLFQHIADPVRARAIMPLPVCVCCAVRRRGKRAIITNKCYQTSAMWFISLRERGDAFSRWEPWGEWRGQGRADAECKMSERKWRLKIKVRCMKT